ncbi:hypothetical protein DMENIID0001_087970 [Sergentomyia squamirostris]
MILIVRRQSVSLLRIRYVTVHTSVINQSKRDDLQLETTKINLPLRSLQESGIAMSKTSPNLASLTHKYYRKLIGTYEELSGAREIREAQEKVIETQERLKEAQEEKRKIVLELLDIRKNLQTLNNDIHAMDKGNPHYLELVRRQIELMQAEREKEKLFKVLDSTERDLFTDLTATVKMSHEKERAHSENSKYTSLVLTIIGTLLGAIVTAASYYYRNHLLKNISDQGEKIDQHIGDLEQILRRDIGELQKILEIIERNQRNQKNVEHKQIHTGQKKNESWSEYFYRHGNNFYRYFFPKQSN